MKPHRHLCTDPLVLFMTQDEPIVIHSVEDEDVRRETDDIQTNVDSTSLKVEKEYGEDFYKVLLPFPYLRPV